MSESNRKRGSNTDASDVVGAHASYGSSSSNSQQLDKVKVDVEAIGAAQVALSNQLKEMSAKLDLLLDANAQQP